jgi:hypothetical protein
MLSRLGEKLRNPSLKDSDKFIEVSLARTIGCAPSGSGLRVEPGHRELHRHQQRVYRR